MVAITPFGLTGPKSQWRATDLEIMAAAGAMSLAGEPGGEPMRVSAPQSCAWAGAQAAVGATMALAARARTGRGQLVDVSAQAAVITALAHAPAFVDIAGTTPTRAGAFITGRSVAGAKYRVFWPCVDGHINFILYGGAAGRRTNEQLVAWMREEGVDPGPLGGVDWSGSIPTQASQAEVDAMEAPIARFLAGLSKREFLEGAHRARNARLPGVHGAGHRHRPATASARLLAGRPAADGRTQRHCGAFYIRNGQRAPAAGAASAPRRHRFHEETEREPASA